MIDFTARLYDLSPKEAAEKLAQGFWLSYDDKGFGLSGGNPTARNRTGPAKLCPGNKKTRRRRQAIQKNDYGWRVLTD